MEYSTSTKS